MKIGMFDSGIGGITVLKEALHTLPDVDYIYYSDNIHAPYGTKDKDEVKSYVHNVVEFLIEQGASVIVIACNTATSIAASTLRQTYDIPIIGMEPAVKVALENKKQGRILVTATPLTLKEEKYQNLVHSFDKNNRVDSLPLPELVDFAEKFIFDERVTEYLKEKLSSYDLTKYKGIVLGCTHFVYFREIIRRIIPPHVELYDGNAGTVNHLRSIVESQIENHQDTKGQVIFYYSGKEDKEHKILNKYLSI